MRNAGGSTSRSVWPKIITEPWRRVVKSDLYGTVPDFPSVSPGCGARDLRHQGHIVIMSSCTEWGSEAAGITFRQVYWSKERKCLDGSPSPYIQPFTHDYENENCDERVMTRPHKSPDHKLKLNKWHHVCNPVFLCPGPGDQVHLFQMNGLLSNFIWTDGVTF